MADLTNIEKFKLEGFLEMEEGYVLSFSNRTFQEFFLENFGIDIYDEKYFYSTGSKANRMRAFWNEESNYLVGTVILALIERETGFSWQPIDEQKQVLVDECQRIAKRLIHDSSIENADVLQTVFSSDREVLLLQEEILSVIWQNKPEVGLDRLHTYMMKYTRNLCDKHSLAYVKTDSLNNLFSKYVKYLEQEKKLESQMTERILKSSISVLDKFNHVRNTQSFAHDNPILNYDESVLICSNIFSLIKFIESIEDEGVEEDLDQNQSAIIEDDLPF